MEPKLLKKYPRFSVITQENAFFVLRIKLFEYVIGDKMVMYSAGNKCIMKSSDRFLTGVIIISYPNMFGYS